MSSKTKSDRRCIVPPKDIQRKLISEGCRVTREQDPKLYEEYLRYKPWCQMMIKRMERKNDMFKNTQRVSKRLDPGSVRKADKKAGKKTDEDEESDEDAAEA